MGLYHLISVTERENELPEEFWLFCRLLEWIGSTRSGVWQYYDGLSRETFDRMSRSLERFGLSDIAEKYQFGRAAWREPDRAAELDEWIDRHERQVESAAFDLILKHKERLHDES